MRKVLVFPDPERNSPAFDEAALAVDDNNDCFVTNAMLSAMLTRSGMVLRGDEESQAREMVHGRANDNNEEHRMRDGNLSSMANLLKIPKEIGEYTELEALNLCGSKITRLPPSIGRLRNLQHLDLHWTKNLMDLPDEIGDLSGLETMTIRFSGIRSLPPSIGKLKNLQLLDLSYADNLWRLPSEIGELSSLETLDLTWSKITSLPASIGRLAKLTCLDLCCTKNLTELPEEIGDATRLNKLNLRSSGITALPPSVGRWKDLRDLDLSNTDNLTKLPEEIGELVGLEEWNLSHSKITELPGSIGRLNRLRHLNLHGAPVLEVLGETETNEFLLALVRRCPSLGSLGGEMKDERTHLGLALACNRARFRAREALSKTPELWPRVLEAPTRAFDAWEMDPFYLYRIPEPDAVYQLLAGCRESMVRVLIDRRRA